jgi:hypothetical protein
VSLLLALVAVTPPDPTPPGSGHGKTNNLFRIAQPQPDDFDLDALLIALLLAA